FYFFFFLLLTFLILVVLTFLFYLTTYLISLCTLFPLFPLHKMLLHCFFLQRSQLFPILLVHYMQLSQSAHLLTFLIFFLLYLPLKYFFYLHAAFLTFYPHNLYNKYMQYYPLLL